MVRFLVRSRSKRLFDGGNLSVESSHYNWILDGFVFDRVLILTDINGEVLLQKNNLSDYYGF
ncbi:hypothetical protein BGP75_23130 [Motiliproteus sp. MSK22-1]|nr:hypothetical protein BGP75_23130 [Motiliproteus sp. MSK22-1]